MFPEFQDLRNTVVELHGSPDSGKTTAILRYIRKLQEEEDSLVYYLDASSKVRTPYHVFDPEKTWFSFNLNAQEERAMLFRAAKELNIIVLDDITFYKGNLWTFMKELQRIAQYQHVTIFVINQMRFVLNHKTQEFEERPYRFNIMEQYCSYAYDLDKDLWIPLCTPKKESNPDSLTDMLINMA